MKKQRTSIMLDRELMKRLKLEALRQDRSVSKLIEIWLRKKLGNKTATVMVDDGRQISPAAVQEVA